MDCKKLGFLLIILTCYTMVFAESYAGKTGLAFLQIGAGGRAVGMGEAFTAVANDASASYWNPAGLARLNKSEFIFTHNKWFQDISHNYAAFAFLINNHTFGISFLSSTVSGIEMRVKPSTEPLGEFDAHDIMVGLSYARSWQNRFKLGITLKYLYEKIYLESALGVAGDLGLIYEVPIQGLALGVTLQNIGTMSAFKNETVTLPSTFKFGFAYQLPMQLYGGLIVATDMVKVFEGSFYVNFGFEYDIRNILALRGGYLVGYDERNFQGGFGFKFSHYRLDYGYAPFSSDLGNSHRVSLGIAF